jgi:hypothetical protein
MHAQIESNIATHDSERSVAVRHKQVEPIGNTHTKVGINN